MAASSAPCGLTSRVLLDPNATTTTTTRGKFGPRSVRLPMLPIVSWKNDSCCSKSALPDELILGFPVETLLSHCILHLHLFGKLPVRTISSKSCLGRTASGSVVAKATGETPAQVSSELPEIVTTVKEAWKKLDDKYAVASLAFIGIIALWSSTGIISAIDKLPIIPGVLELIGIGYTGWFVYNNLLYKPDREALIEKVKSTYSDIIGNSS
ncbi:hypothetical protein ZIOFF_021741 [Zingiber officinale]|uniref:Cyanobacterial aminoacyl-tRNA synthetase CAAD domain-containing protein n=1 Tax=Zingiber officinale TaxID=94328 RepID=A0A8J5HC74_ZINOF|nr:hypothetical protein ZIOFF_021741 [Zingiber officinale]